MSLRSRESLVLNTTGIVLGRAARLDRPFWLAEFTAARLAFQAALSLFLGCLSADHRLTGPEAGTEASPQKYPPAE